MAFTIDSDITDTSLNNKVTFENVKAYIASKPGAFNSPLQHRGQTIVDEANKNGLSAIWVLAHACHESAYGTSIIAINKNNLFGIAVFDSVAGAGDKYVSLEACIQYYCKWFKGFYMTPGTWVYNGKTPRGANAHYATDKNWANAIVNIMNDYVKFAKIDTNTPSVPSTPATNLNIIDDMANIDVAYAADRLYWIFPGRKLTPEEAKDREYSIKTKGLMWNVDDMANSDEYKARISKADNYDSAVQGKDLTIQSKDKTIGEISNQLQEADQKLTKASQDLDTKNEEIKTLNTELQKANDTILSLKNQPNKLAEIWTKIISILPRKNTKKD